MATNTQESSIQHHSNAPKNPRNLWPYGILAVIFIGIILICVSVYISVKHPVNDNKPFFQKHSDTEEHINDLLADTMLLGEYYDFYIQANAKPTRDSVFRPYSPYFRPPHRDKDEQNPSTILFTKEINTLYLLADVIEAGVEEGKSLKDLSIQAFIQKIGGVKPQEIHIYDPSTKSFIKSTPKDKESHIPIGELTFDAKRQLFISPSFEVEIEGRWIVSLQITAKQGDQDIYAVLEQEFFSMPKPRPN